MKQPVALITGGSRGIGRGIAAQLAADGYCIIINFRSDSASAQSIQDEIQAAEGTCHLVQADIALESDRQKLIEQAKLICGRCDLLINNAGVAPQQRLDILQTTEASYDRVMNTNLKGPFFLTQLIANWMIDQIQTNPECHCRIINIGSLSAYTGSTSRGEYCLSKAGIGMMTQLFADRLAEFNIGVFEVRPGIIQTDMTSAVQEKYDRMIAEGLTPIRRWGQPKDVALAVSAIAAGLLDFCPGQVINADGGFHLRRL